MGDSDNIEVKKQFTINDFSDFLDDLPAKTESDKSTKPESDKPEIVEVEQLNINSVESVKPAKKKRARRKRCSKCDILYPPEKFDNPDIHSCIERTEQSQPESETEEKTEEKRDPRYAVDMAAKNLYNLQFTAYYMVESALKSADRDDMDGLTMKMEDMKDQYLHVFEQIYEEHGSEYLDEVLSPVVLWGMLTTQNVASTYINNKKKKSDEK